MFHTSLRGLFYISILLAFLFGACEDSTPVGSNIFEDEDLEVLFTDDIQLVTQTVKVGNYENYRTAPDANAIRSIECRDGSLPLKMVGQPETHYLGSLDDPIFGKRKSSIYLEMLPGTELGNSSFPPPEYQNATFDSMVLVLSYDTASVYGDVTETFDVEVFRVLEDMNVNAPATNNSEFMFSEEPIASRTDVTYSQDTLRAFIPNGDSIQQPALRIAFDPLIIGDRNHLPTQIFENPAASLGVTDFRNLFKGLYVTTSSESNVMVGFDINSSRMEVFFTEDDGAKEVYIYIPIGKEFNNTISDPSGTDAEAAAQTMDSDLLYIAGQDGYDVNIDISDALRFQEFAINKAELEFTVSEPADINATLFPPSSRLIISQVTDEGELTCIDDMILGETTILLGTLFGGLLTEVEENGTVLRKYRMNITAHLQNILEGEATSNMLLSVDNRSEDVRRSVLFGPNHPTHPAKLNLTYTVP